MQISTSGIDDLALRADGSLAGWGANYYGEDNLPAGVSNVVAMASGWTFTLALTAGGTVVAWGANSDRETNVPGGLQNVVAISAAALYGTALIGNGPPA